MEALKRLPKNKKIIIVGHSRGGALSALGKKKFLKFFKKLSFVKTAALLLSMQGYVNRVELMTFGKPRIGNKEFAQFLNKTVKIKWRVVNKKDLIPRLPPTFGLKYHHSTREIWFPKNHQQYMICSSSDGEDRKCSHSILIPNGIDDHVQYLGIKIRDGVKFGCE